MPDCVCLMHITMRLKIHRMATRASMIQVLGCPCHHIECDYRLGYKNWVCPCTTHCTLIPIGTTNMLFRINYYWIGPRSAMRLLKTAVVLFLIVMINEQHSIITTIMQFRIFKPKTMDKSNAPSERHGYKRVPKRGPTWDHHVWMMDKPIGHSWVSTTYNLASLVLCNNFMPCLLIHMMTTAVRKQHGPGMTPSGNAPLRVCKITIDFVVYHSLPLPLC
jgi:hypothetical protein